MTNILHSKEFIRLHFYNIHEAGRSAAALEQERWLSLKLSIENSSSSIHHLCIRHPTFKNPVFLVSPYSCGAMCLAKSFWLALLFPVGERENHQINMFFFDFCLHSLHPSGRVSHLQLYMIMALMAALLMRLRCFLLRRGEAGRNGAWRAAGEMGATVERAERNHEKVEDTVNTKVNTKQTWKVEMKWFS